MSAKFLKGSSRKVKELEMNEKLKLIDTELLTFYDYCKQMGFSDEEMDIVCSPLNDIVQKNNLKKIVKLALILIGIVGSFYFASQVNSVGIHASAFGRLAMIKILPFWDWRYLFYESCMFSNPFYGEYSLTEDDCMACENIDAIDVLNDVSYDYLMDNYLNRDVPVIVTDAMDTWPSLNSHYFNFDNITDTYLADDRLIDSVPCSMNSNLRTGSSDLFAFLKRIRNPNVDKWFVHWQNCDIHGVKALRKFYQRPYFIPNTMSPAHFNWVLMSSNYMSTNYKKVELDTGLIMLSQLQGETAFRLTPARPCNETCPQLYGTVEQGEILVFTNYLWTLEYYPGPRTSNIAILTETMWD